MSMRAVVITLVLAILLGLATILLLEGPSLGLTRRSSSVPIGSRLFDVPLSSVTSVEVAFADGTTDRIHRVSTLDKASGPRAPEFASDAEWLVETTRTSQAAPSPAWPVASSSIQGLLRALADTTSVAEPTRQHTLGDEPTRVKLSYRDGSATVITLASRTLAGTGLIEVVGLPPPMADASNATSQQAPGGLSPASAPRRALVPDDLHRVFTSPGPRGWRERAVLGVLASSASRITLENAKQRLALSKTAGAWVLREPVSVLADPVAVAKLLSALARVQIAEFLDTPPAGLTGLDSPSAKLLIEADQRSLVSQDPSADPATDQVKVQTFKVELIIGAPVDAQARRLFARIDGVQVVQLDSAGLDALSLDPAQFVPAHPARSAVADLTAVTLERLRDAAITHTREFARAELRWTERRLAPKPSLAAGGQSPSAPAEPTSVPLTDEDAQELDDLVRFLTGTGTPRNDAAPTSPEAARPTIVLSPPEGFKHLASIRLFGAQSRLAEHIEIGVVSPGQITFRTGPVFRSYPQPRVPAIIQQWLLDPASSTAADAPIEPSK
jgi:Domain of unknown function (DUF4340)